MWVGSRRKGGRSALRAAEIRLPASWSAVLAIRTMMAGSDYSRSIRSQR